MHELRRINIALPEIGLSAVLAERMDGGPIRTAADVSQKRAVGRYASQTNGRGQFWESWNELHAFYGVEVATEVVKYRAQPHTLEMPLDGKVCRYTPDRMDHLTGERTEIVEIKDRYKPEKDPDYHAKLERAALVYQSLGWSFRLTTRDEIEAEPEFEAVKYIQSFRRTAITQGDEDAALELLDQRGIVALAEFRALWSSPVLGFAKMCALMVKRTIHMDFRGGLSDATPVHSVDG